MPVSARASRPSSSLATPRATSVSASRPPRRWPPPSALPSSSPSSASSPSVAATGVPTSVPPTPCPASRAASAVPSPSAYVQTQSLIQQGPSREGHNWLTQHLVAHPRPPWYRPRRLPRRQALPPARRCRGRLHLLRRLHQDPREHPQGHLRRRHQHLRLPHPQPLDRDQAPALASRGVRRHPSRGPEAVLSCIASRLRSKNRGLCGVTGAFSVFLFRFIWQI